MDGNCKVCGMRKMRSQCLNPDCATIMGTPIPSGKRRGTQRQGVPRGRRRGRGGKSG